MKQVPRKSTVCSISPTSLLLKDPVAIGEICIRACEEASSFVQKVIKEAGYMLEDIQKMWSKVDLINNLDFANEMTVRVSYSKSDTVIIPEQTKKVVEKPKELNPAGIKLKENYFLGHYLTTLWVWLNWRTVYSYSFLKPNKKTS
jgi:hypothetical protein